MSIDKIAQKHARLIKVEAVMPPPDESKRLIGVILHFGSHQPLFLSVNPNEDTLLWASVNFAKGKLIPIEEVFPSVARAYGLFLVWVWEMRNNNGYFDAVQLELRDQSLQKPAIIQFKAAASAIDIFDVSMMNLSRGRIGVTHNH